MAVIGFEDMEFKPHGNGLRAFFYKRYYFDIDHEELDILGPWKTTPEGDLDFENASEKKAWNKMSRAIDRGMRRLTHLLYNKPTAYIQSTSDIPLVGSNEFGICDRGSNVLEVKPLTGCNFNCIYCSVDEGKNKKTHDYLVEMEYLVETVAWIAETKEHPVECNIGPQGEPLLYPKIVELVQGLKDIPNVEVISINTNGSLLTKQLIDELAEAGLTRINLSLNALDQEVANTLSGTAYPLGRVKEMIKYCQEKEGNKIAILIAPTYVPGYNENEMEALVKISRGIKSDFPTMGIQNFLNYPKGRNPAKQRPWEEFYRFIDELEKKTGASLKSTMEEFKIFKEQELPKPWKKGQTINARIVLPGRYPKELVAAAGSGKDARCITIINASSQAMSSREVKIKLIRDKHNIYKGTIH